MSWFRAISNCLNQCWHRFMSPHGFIRPRWVNLHWWIGLLLNVSDETFQYIDALITIIQQRLIIQSTQKIAKKFHPDICREQILIHWYWDTSRVPIQLGLYSLSGKTSYRKISWSLEAARFEFRLFQSLWNLTGTSAAALPRWLSNFGGIRSL